MSVPISAACLARSLPFVVGGLVQTTVHEALMFSSRLRFTSEIDNETVREFVEEVHPQLAWLIEVPPITPFFVLHFAFLS